jgi:hypothetical protein
VKRTVPLELPAFKSGRAKGCYLLQALALLLVTGCGGTAVPTKEGLETRAKAYWQLRQKGDWGSVYDYLVLEERKFVQRSQFIDNRSKQITFREYQIMSVEVTGSTGVTNVKCKWQVAIPGDLQPFRDGETSLTEHWVFQEGNWYLRMLKPPGS